MPFHESSSAGQEGLAGGSAPGSTEDAPMQVEDNQPSPPSVSRPTQSTKPFFGMAHDARRRGYSRPVFNDDYVAQFAEDPYGQEAAPNARVYRVYVEEAAAFDENMVGQSRDGLDVMLVFAGLFSAVVTSFLVQVSQNLQADFSEMSALLLHDLLVVQLSIADGATVNITTPSINPSQKFEPDVIDVWINGLWVVSLITSLVVALAAVLVKQWLHRYMTFPSGTPELRSHVRQFRFMGLEKWRVRIIIGMLPIIMHISLMLFFAGVVLFYIPLRVSLAWAVGSITVLVAMLYLVSNTIPIVIPQCPYQTPLTDFIHHVYQVVRFGTQHIRQLWRKAIHLCFVARRRICNRDIPSEHQSSTDSEVLQYHLLAQLESAAVRDAHDTLSVDALDWLYQMSLNPAVHSIVLQGISGLPAASRSYAATKWSAASDMQSQRYQLIREALPSFDLPGHPWVLERLCRSYLFLPTVPNEHTTLLENEINDKPWSRDPRIIAATWVASGCILMRYNEFFANHSDVLLHPLIWEEVVRCIVKTHFTPDIDNCLFAQFLSAVIVPPPVGTSPSVSMMTGAQVAWTRLQPEIWGTLLRHPCLAPYDSIPAGSTTSYHRTLIAAGKLALSHLEHSQHLTLLNCVVRLIARPDVTLNVDQWTVDFDFLCSVMTMLSDISSSSIQLQELHSFSQGRLQQFYHQASSSLTFKFHFPRLEFVLQTWASFYDCTRYDSNFEWGQYSYLGLPMEILGNALSCGYEDTYRIIRDERWLGIVFTEWAICGSLDVSFSQFIKAYIKGLHTLAPDSNRREFCEYLYQPQQLILGFLLIIAANTKYFKPSNFLPELVGQLAKICPTHTSWKECSTALKAFLAWAQTPTPEISQFPWPSSLEYLSATAAFRKYPLIDWMARRLTSPEMREGLEIGLETLHGILENAESVEGVLIPDLESQLSIDTASSL